MLGIIFTSFYMGLFGGWQSVAGFLRNPDALIPYSDAAEKGIIDSNDFKGSSGFYFKDKLFVDFTNGLQRGVPPPSQYFGPEADFDANGHSIPVVYGTGNLESNVYTNKDLRGKNFLMSYYGSAGGGSGARGTISYGANCGGKSETSSVSNQLVTYGTLEIHSSLINDKDYVFLLNGAFVCSGELKPGEKLTVGVSGSSDIAGVLIATYEHRWRFPYICTPEEGMDLAEQTFRAGETVTLAGMRRWPKGLCNELAPILINQDATPTAGGVERIPELLDRLAQPPRDDPNTVQDESLYVVPPNSLLKVQYWIEKDASLPTPCYDPILQGFYNLNTLACDKNVNLRTFCSGTFVNGECITSTDLRIAFNCTGGMDQTQNPPVCKIGTANRINQLAFCKPGDGTSIDPNACTGGARPLTNNSCPNGRPSGSLCSNPVTKTYYEPYTNFQDACNAAKGTINPNNPDECITPDVPIQLVPKDPNTPVNSLTLGSGTFNSNTGDITTNAAINICQKRLPDGTCATVIPISTGNSFIGNWMETIHEWPYYENTKNKHALFWISLLTISLILLQYLLRWGWSKLN